MAKEQEDNINEDYGVITLVNGEKIPIESFLQAEYKDHRLISVVKFNGNYGITIENPPSTGRSNQNLHITKESLIALISTTLIYFEMSGIDIKSEITDATKFDSINFSYSKDLEPKNILGG